MGSSGVPLKQYPSPRLRFHTSITASITRETAHTTEVYLKSFLLETTIHFAREKISRAEIKLSTEVLRIGG